MVDRGRSTRGREATWRPAAGRQAGVRLAGCACGPCAPDRRTAARLGAGRCRAGPAGALARHRLRLRDHPLLHRRSGARSSGPRRCCLSPPWSWPCLARNRPIAFPLALALAAASAGFLTATAKRASSLIRCCRRPPGTSTSPASSKRAKSASAPTASSCAFTASPARGSTSRRSACACRCARAPRRRSRRFVEFKARLSPPLEPLRPGGYDFARNLYFQGIGASGFVLGRIRTVGAAAAAGAAAARGGDDRRHARRPRPPHPLGPERRPRRDRVGADHRQARRDLDAGERRDVHLRARPRAVDLRLSHGGGRGR